MSELKLNVLNFEDVISEGVVLVDFYADWCGPCKMIAPVIEEIANERSNITVGKLNVDNDSEIAARFNVFSIPTLIIFEDGNEKTRLVGYKSKDEIMAAID